MTSKNSIPQNAFFIRKQTSIRRAASHIDNLFDRFAEVQLRCAGTAVQKAILVAQKAIQLGFAQYSRFTTQLVPHDGRQIIYTIIKLKRASKTRKTQAPRRQQRQQQRETNQQRRNQGNQRYEEKYDRKNKGDYEQRDRRGGKTYNQDHRQRNQRRERQNYRQENDNRGNRNNERRNNDNRREREYR